MRWEMDPASAVGRLNLVATTYTYENGNVRSRTLHRTHDPIAALRLSDDIKALGGRLEGKSPSDLYARWQEGIE